MAYAEGNPKTKKAFKEMVNAGDVYIIAAGIHSPKQNGIEFVEGPQAPLPHRWYSKVEVKDGIIVKVLS